MNDRVINISDPNLRIYRVIDYSRLKDIYLTSKLVLRRPSKWEDPFENILLKAKVRIDPSGNVVCIRGVLDIFFGQCWSDNHDETDAMWRVYAPNANGVRISTTVDKLYTSVVNAIDRHDSTSVFIGKVTYEQSEIILTRIKDPVIAKRIVLSADGYDAVKCLLVKRIEFEHESEIRLLLRDEVQKMVPEFVSECVVSVDPFTLIDDIVLDPRMPQYRASCFGLELRSLGVKAPICQSKLYQVPDITVAIDASNLNDK